MKERDGDNVIRPEFGKPKIPGQFPGDFSANQPAFVESFNPRLDMRAMPDEAAELRKRTVEDFTVERRAEPVPMTDEQFAEAQRLYQVLHDGQCQLARFVLKEWRGLSSDELNKRAGNFLLQFAEEFTGRRFKYSDKVHPDTEEPSNE